MEKSNKRIHESSAGGHIDVAYGIYDRPGPDNDSDFTFDIEPIVPKEQMSVQISKDRPPVDDPDYLPGNSGALELAVAALSASIPTDQIQKFYRHVRDKAEELIDGELMKNTVGAGDDMMESKIRKMIAEVIEDEDFSQKDLEQMQKDFDDEFGSVDDSPAPEPVQDEASLEKIASETGFSGPSGAKNFLYRLLARMARFVDVPKDEIDALVDFAAGEYIDVMQQADLIDEEDAEFMEQNKSMVSDLPSFKYFIGTAIAGPALKELERTGKKKVTVFLDKLNLTDSAKNTVLNQLMGQVPRNDELISKKIDLEVAAGKMTQSQGDDAKQKLGSGFEAMKKLAMTGDDFVEVALQKYSKMPKSKLVDIIRKAGDDQFVAERM